MKLGEALTMRKKQATRLNDLRGRIKANALVQEGDSPQEDIEELLAEYNVVSDEHRSLVLRINKTNAEAILGEQTLLETLADREDLIRQRNTLSLAIEAASPNRNDYRYMRTEIKFVPQVDVARSRVKLDELSGAVTGLDLLIQAKNWQQDLSE